MEFFLVAERLPPRETTVLARGWVEKKQHYVWAFAEYVVEVAHRGWKDRSHGTRLPEMWLWFEPVEWAYLPHPPPPSDLGERGEKGLECPGAVGAEITCVTDWQWENNPTPDGKWKWHCEACGTLTNDGECDCTKFIETMRLQRLVRYSNP
jgi:hypothetical protein